MGTAPNGYNTPKTNWAAGNVPAASDFNRIEGNIYGVEEGSRTIDQAQTPSSNQGNLRQFKAILRLVCKQNQSHHRQNELV